ncbi:hypothetical protein COT30_00455 [Candidatus Micrarchaeota archaeon CG08_land_8_20_14_0_20_49_17]|nr:MAG: hypothetical protein AUJ13_03060 [Candidatus Micrarchaeota archaeon CG1_02_49_24]PIU10205.1 MAG: hypothetical protein COT30_00455 [Candidatus Micrarchaeota archaeon CG08_land_8_20_14_0_20_49_17]PIU82435.1 MAG: hypothetical protein COS70_01330 [Candidatus Micrarchaeota archaeon CG06_land_8_20_14_3_00_50_6]PJA00202.1 MAG: hypothetical protein COX84_00055 [Candidatus Micrarchaeota archaeon CG_4_10_14_0_2_um_filter_49_7]HII53805.1 DUF2283 domain-containing protein [Candidatus Micrarchaeota 
MKYKYDNETDILVITLSDEKPDFGAQKGDIITHYNKEYKPVEIEILSASKTALDMFKAMVLAKKVAAR